MAGSKKETLIGLILAAGYSSRMKAFKPLLPIGDATAVERIAEVLRTAGVENIVGVSGFQRELLEPVLSKNNIIEAYNRDFDRGMFSSIQTGIRKAMGEFSHCGGFFLMLVDCPLIPAEVLELIAEKHREHPTSFILPSYRGKNGHPLFIPAIYAEEILSYEGEGGLKTIRNRHEDRLIKLEVEQEAVVMDMDTPEGYEEILDYFHSRHCGADQNKFAEDSIEGELQGKRIFFVRHGEIQQHKEKIFLGQTDVPLSEAGKAQALEAADQLRKYDVNVRRIYSSDLSRAVQTAEIIRNALSGSAKDSSTEVENLGTGPEQISNFAVEENIELILEPKLREMSLGPWDGKYIGEIKEQYPEEYRKRGENFLSYKFGNDSENFYDLRYRAVNGFRQIIQKEKEADADRTDADRTDLARTDLVIVAHLGVLQMILSSLRHTEMKDEVKKSIPNGGIVIMDYSQFKTKEK